MNPEEKTVARYKPTPTWFFVKSELFELSRDTTDDELSKALDDGHVFALEETAAARILDPEKSSWQRQDIKLIGYSDCTALAKHMREGRLANEEVEIRNKKLGEAKMKVVEREKYLIKGQSLSEADIATAMQDFDVEKSALELYIPLLKEAMIKEVRIAITNKKTGGFPLPVFQKVFTPNASPTMRRTLLNELAQTA